MTTVGPDRRTYLISLAVTALLLGAAAFHAFLPFTAWRGTAPSPVPAGPGWPADQAVSYGVAWCCLGVAAWLLIRQRSTRQGLWFALLSASGAVLISAVGNTPQASIMVGVQVASWPLASLGFTLAALELFRADESLQRLEWAVAALSILLSLITGAALALSGSDSLSRALFTANQVILICAGITFVVLLVRACLVVSFARARLQAQAVLVGTVIAGTPLLAWLIAAGVQSVLGLVDELVTFQPVLILPPLIALPLSAVYALERYPPLDPDQLRVPVSATRRTYRESLQRYRQDLASSLDLGYILDQLATHALSLLNVDHVVVLMHSQTSGRYEYHASWGSINEGAIRDIALAREDTIIALLQRRQPIQLESETLHSLSATERRQIELMKAAVVAPVRSRENLLGIVVVGDAQSGDRLAPDEIALLQSITDQAAAAAENALRYARQVEQEQRLVRQTRQLTDILALGNQLKSLDREMVVQNTVDAIHTSLGFGLVTLSLVVRDDPSRVRVVAWAGVDSSTWERLASRSLPLIDPEVIAGVHRLGDCYFVHARGTEPGISSPHRDVPWREGDQLFVPLTSSEGLLGYLSADSPISNLRPTEDQLEVLEIFANQAAIAIQNADLYASIDRALDERVAELATLQEIDRQINLKLDFHHVMDVTLDWAMRITSAVAGTLALVSKDQQTSRIVAHRGYSTEISRFSDAPWPIEKGLIERVIRSAAPIMSEDVTHDADYVDHDFAVRSHLAAPIMREDMVIGVISLESNEPDGFTADHLAFLTRLADHAAIAIENAMLYEETNSRVAELSALQQISLDLTSRLNLGAVLDSIAANTLKLTDADQITIYLYDEHRDELSFGAGLTQRGRQDRPPIPISENPLTTQVVRQAKPIVVSNAQEHELVSNLDWGIGAIASIPLQKAEHVLGAFDISFKGPHSFTEEELRALNLLADQAAIAIENAQFYADAQQATTAKSIFVDTVSNALKPPITSVKAYAQLLAQGAAGALSDQQAQFANVIHRNAELVERFMSDLADLSRIEAGQLRLALRPVEVNKLVGDLVRSLSDQSEDWPVSVEIRPGLPKALVDPARISQAWGHLLRFVHSRAPDDAPITVSVDRHIGLGALQAREAWLLCEVTVEELELGPQERERMLQSLYVAPKPGQRAEQSTGLELSIARALIELHGGHVWIDSHPQGWTTFSFTLPGTLSPAE